ncbi:hypothetical protein B551_0221850 [Cupriavidus sp. HPC(L)]|nr:hypothetical protein B551_0221850 [Cupriavidus sp. HPC(L)]
MLAREQSKIVFLIELTNFWSVRLLAQLSG